jgi:hypothetical protein
MEKRHRMRSLSNKRPGTPKGETNENTRRSQKRVYRTSIGPGYDGHYGSHTRLRFLGSMAGTTGLEPATSAVTVSQKPVTYWNQEARMATQSTLRNPWQPLSHP